MNDPWAYLKGCFERGRLAHAYLLEGSPSGAAGEMAMNLAKLLMCKGPGSKPCGTCEGCRRVQEKNHPDVIRVEPESKSRLPETLFSREESLFSGLPIRFIYHRDEIFVRTPYPPIREEKCLRCISSYSLRKKTKRIEISTPSFPIEPPSIESLATKYPNRLYLCIDKTDSNKVPQNDVQLLRGIRFLNLLEIRQSQ